MRISRTVATVTGVIVIAGGASGVAYAASSTDSAGTSPSASAPSSGATGSTGTQAGHGKHANKHHALMRRALHGSFTVKTKDGYRTVTVQRGSITGDGAGKITVTSEDKYAHAYTVTSTTRVRIDRAKSSASKLATGQQVVVLTSPKSGPSTAAAVVVHTPKQKATSGN